MKKRIFYVLCCVTMLVTLLAGCFPFNILPNNQGSSGVIGGADGPTSVVVTPPSEEESESESAYDDSNFNNLLDNFNSQTSSGQDASDDVTGISGELWYSSEDSEEYWEFGETTVRLHPDVSTYYDADYEIYYDEDAVDYIVNELSEYGITEEEQRGFMESTPDYEHYICLVLSNIYFYENDVLVETNTETSTPFLGFIIVENGITFYDLINMKSATYMSFYKYDTEFSSETQRIGVDGIGYVDVPANFVPFNNDVYLGENNIQYSDLSGNNIVTLQTYDNNGKTAEIYAQVYASTLISDPQVDQESLTGATVTIDDREAFQVYCYYPDYDRFLVAWIYDDPDGNTIHYISAEFTPENYNLFEMVENTYHLDY